MKAMAMLFNGNMHEASFGRQLSCASNTIIDYADVGILTSVFYAVIISGIAVIVRIRKLFNNTGFYNAFA